MCQIQLTVSCNKVPKGPSSTTNFLLPALCLTFGTAVIAWGGLGSLQSLVYHSDSNLASIGAAFASSNYFTGIASASKVFRFWWFVLSYESFLVMWAITAIMFSYFHRLRATFVGLFAVGTILFIWASNAFLTASDNTFFDDDLPKDRMRTAVAGFISTAAMSAIVTFLCGILPHSSEATNTEASAPAVAGTAN